MDWNETKAIVIDDKRADVRNLLLLLNQKGTPYNYYYEDGDLNNLPSTPLKNVRLVFLDFVLGTDGSGEKNKISTLISVLKSTLSVDNGPYILFAWTLENYEGDGVNNLLPRFKEALFGTGLPKPFAIIDLDKINTMNDLSLIEQKIDHELGGSNVFELLLHWEMVGSGSLADTLRDLTVISQQKIPSSISNLDEYSLRLQNEVEKHMYQFAKSMTGGNVRTESEMLIDSQLSLNGILQDYFEKNIIQAEYNLADLITKIQAHSNQRYDFREKAKMNTYFLISERGDSRVRPGNIYKKSQIVTANLRENVIGFNKIVLYKSDKYKDRKNRPGVPEKFKELTATLVPVLFEITPQCDYVQGNWKGARFIHGVLWPYKFNDGTDTEGYLEKAEKKHFKITIEYNGKPYFLILHIDYQLIIPHSRMTNPRPLLSAKKELLNDVQHWCASQAARPGKTEF